MFVCFKWRRIKTGFQLPAVCDYTARHVNVLRAMLARHVRIPHRLVCVTDDPSGIDPRVEVVPLWDKCRSLGGCYNRLWVFSEEAGELFGPRFVCIDLDVVLVRDCTPLFDRSEPFVINAYNPGRNDRNDQHYNGGMFLMDAGARASVWTEFDPATTPAKVQADARLIGTDQAWIRLHLGKGEARWTRADGVYEARMVRYALPGDAKLVLFAGRRDPSQGETPWVRRHWHEDDSVRAAGRSVPKPASGRPVQTGARAMAAADGAPVRSGAASFLVLDERRDTRRRGDPVAR